MSVLVGGSKWLGPTQRQGVTAELIENGPNRRGGPLGRLLLLVGHRLIGVGANIIITKKVFARLTIDSEGCDRYKCGLSHLVRAGVMLRRRRKHRNRSVVTGFQKRNRSPTVGAILLRWRKPEANPPFTC